MANNEKGSFTHVANLEVLSHEQVEGGAGVGADGADAGTAVAEQAQAQVRTLLRLLLKQELRVLGNGQGGGKERGNICK